MVTIREEKLSDAVAREALLDEAYGSDRFTKTSARLREGRLPAAGLSLVAVDHGQLVGTVLTLAQYTTSPREILESMNMRMLARSGGGFTTCLILRADADGTVTIANAGHLSPYINGIEASVENSLPLGVSAQSHYPETTVQLSEKTQLTLLTDGVVEARSKTGELFSFDRTASIATESAKSIASAAQHFGQDDDITVVTLTRQPLPVPTEYALT